jgi:hypothetical protein
MYDKDWEVQKALEDPSDPIHAHIDQQLEDRNEDLLPEEIVPEVTPEEIVDE